MVFCFFIFFFAPGGECKFFKVPWLKTLSLCVTLSKLLVWNFGAFLSFFNNHIESLMGFCLLQLLSRKNFCWLFSIFSFCWCLLSMFSGYFIPFLSYFVLNFWSLYYAFLKFNIFPRNWSVVFLSQFWFIQYILSLMFSF